MNMTLSKRGDYVMRSAISLARAYEAGGTRKIREVVADTEVPRTFASQILADLVRAGLATSRAGRDGGYRLSRRPEEISVLQVVEAAEGPLRAERCALGEGPCRWDAVCPLHETWSRATSRLADLLSGTTLAEVASLDEAIEAGLYAVPPDSHRAYSRAVPLSDLVHVELAAQAVHVELDARRNWSSFLSAAADEVAAPEGDGSRLAPTAAGSSPTGSTAADCSINPVAGAGATSTPAYELAWRLSAPQGRSTFEGELQVEAVDSTRCALMVSGQWRQEVDGGQPPGTGELEERGRRVLRGVLRRAARSVEAGTPAERS